MSAFRAEFDRLGSLIDDLDAIAATLSVSATASRDGTGAPASPEALAERRAIVRFLLRRAEALLREATEGMALLKPLQTRPLKVVFLTEQAATLRAAALDLSRGLHRRREP